MNGGSGEALRLENERDAGDEGRILKVAPV
jgi:hypothetical protein